REVGDELLGADGRDHALDVERLRGAAVPPHELDQRLAQRRGADRGRVAGAVGGGGQRRLHGGGRRVHGGADGEVRDAVGVGGRPVLRGQQGVPGEGGKAPGEAGAGRAGAGAGYGGRHAQASGLGCGGRASTIGWSL